MTTDSELQLNSESVVWFRVTAELRASRHIVQSLSFIAISIAMMLLIWRSCLQGDSSHDKHTRIPLSLFTSMLSCKDKNAEKSERGKEWKSPKLQLLCLWCYTRHTDCGQLIKAGIFGCHFMGRGPVSNSKKTPSISETAVAAQNLEKVQSCETCTPPSIKTHPYYVWVMIPYSFDFLVRSQILLSLSIPELMPNFK